MLEETQRWQTSSSSESKRKKENLTTQSVEIETLSCKLLVAWRDRLRNYTCDILVQKQLMCLLWLTEWPSPQLLAKKRDKNKLLRIYSFIIHTFKAVKQPVFGHYRWIKNAVLVKAMCPRIALKRFLLIFNIVEKSLIKTNLLLKMWTRQRIFVATKSGVLQRQRFDVILARLGIYEKGAVESFAKRGYLRINSRIRTSSTLIKNSSNQNLN